MHLYFIEPQNVILYLTLKHQVGLTIDFQNQYFNQNVKRKEHYFINNTKTESKHALDSCTKFNFNDIVERANTVCDEQYVHAT